MVLKCFENPASGLICPSFSTLEKYLSIGEKKIRSIIRSLGKKKLLSVKQKRNESGKFFHNVYILNSVDIIKKNDQEYLKKAS